MNIEAFLLCDAATEQQGKLNVLGAFDKIWVRKTPAKHPACAVAVRIRFEKIEEGSHKIRLQMIDEDGNTAGPKLDGNINVRFAPNSNSAVANLVLNIRGLEIKKYGEYRFDLAVDDQMAASLPFSALEIPNQTGQT